MKENSIEIKKIQYDIFKQDEIVCFIIDLIVKHRGYSLEYLRAINKNNDLSETRHLIIYLIRTHTRYSLSLIGEFFCRNSSSVLFSENKVNNLSETDKHFRRQLNQLNIEIEAFKNTKNTKLSTFHDLIDRSGLSSQEKTCFIIRYLEAE